MVMKNRTFVLCDGDRVNSYGFRTSLAGLDLRRFEANPVMLFSHDSERVIGRWLNVRIEDNTLKAEAEFDSEDDFAAKVASKVERGFLKGCSVGMRILHAKKEKGAVTVDRAELMEASVVSVPADNGAVCLYSSAGVRMHDEDVGVMLGMSHHGTETGNILFLNDIEMGKKENFTEVSDVVSLLGLTGDVQLSPVVNAAVLSALKERDELIGSLRAELQKSEERAIDACLQDAVTHGRITLSEKEEYRRLALAGNFESVKKLIDLRPARASVSLAELAGASKKNGGGKDRADWTYLRWMKEDSEGLQRMKKEDPEGFEELKKGCRN
jgi:HK97 family phage prohead protease